MSKRHSKNKKDKKNHPVPAPAAPKPVKPVSRVFTGHLTYRGNVVADIIGNVCFAPRIETADVSMVKWVATEATYDEATNTTRVELDGEELGK